MAANNAFETLQSLCISRKSTRRFANKEVSFDLLEKIISVAKTSPYASNFKNWDIQVVSSKELINNVSDSVQVKIQELELLVKDDLRAYFQNYSKSFVFFNEAPVLLVLSYRISPVMQGLMGSNANEEILKWERDNFTKSISCVAMLILLAAESLGLGACYMTGPIIDQDKIMKIIESKPGRELGAIIPIGYKD